MSKTNWYLQSVYMMYCMGSTGMHKRVFCQVMLHTFLSLGQIIFCTCQRILHVQSQCASQARNLAFWFISVTRNYSSSELDFTFSDLKIVYLNFYKIYKYKVLYTDTCIHKYKYIKSSIIKFASNQQRTYFKEVTHRIVFTYDLGLHACLTLINVLFSWYWCVSGIGSVLRAIDHMSKQKSPAPVREGLQLLTIILERYYLLSHHISAQAQSVEEAMFSRVNLLTYCTN